MIEELKKKKLLLGDIIPISWQVIQKSYMNILLTSVLFYLPAFALYTYLPFMFEAGDWKVYLYKFLIQILLLLSGLIVSMAVIYITKQTLLGKDVTLGDALKKAFSKCPGAIVTSFIAALIILGMSLLLLIPGIIWSNYYIFATFVVALKKEIYGKKALNYSKSLVNGRWWNVLAYTLAIGIVHSVIIFAASLPFSFLPDKGLSAELVVYTMLSFYFVTMTVYFLNLDYMKKAQSSEEATN